MSQILRLYDRLLNRYPIFVQSIQTSILALTGDAVAQVIIEKKSLQNYNFVRSTQFLAVGFFLTGPTLSIWYRFLARRIGQKGSIVTLKKVALDQLVFAPCFISVFLVTLGTVQGKTLNGTVDNIRRDYCDILLANYKLWPCVQVVNFYLVPLNYQVLLVQCVAILWNSYLSWKTQLSSEKINE